MSGAGISALPASAPVHLRIGPDVTVDATAVDISLGGMLVSVTASVTITVGRVLDICLPEEIGWVEARVARVHDRDGDDGARWGLELGEMDPAVRRCGHGTSSRRRDGAATWRRSRRGWSTPARRRCSVPRAAT